MLGENTMLKISDLLRNWKRKKILWNLSSAMDFKDLLYTHPSYLEQMNIEETPEVYIHTDFCRDILERLKLSDHYFKNFKYSENDIEELKRDTKPRLYSLFFLPFYESGEPYYNERDYDVKEINNIIFEHKSGDGFKTRITLLTSERILNDLGIDQFNSIKYVQFPELGFPEFFALKLKLKVESNLYSTRILDVYYFFMENVNFLRDIVFSHKLKLPFIHYMHDGKGFGYNNHSNLWILKYLKYLNTKFILLYTSYFRMDEMVDEDYLSFDLIDQLHESILEKEEFLRKIPKFYFRSFQIKAFQRNNYFNFVWARPVPS